MKKKKILVLDDESGLASLLAERLGTRATIVAPRIFGDHGEMDTRRLADAFAEKFDLLLLDVVWKSKDRDNRRPFSIVHSLNKAFRNRPLKPPLKCCLVTAYKVAESAQKALADQFRETLGAHLKFIGILSKPLTEASLAEFVENVWINVRGPKTPDKIMARIGDFQLPARILNKEGHIESQNESWVWPQDHPSPALKGQDREFVVPDIHKGSAAKKDKLTRRRYLKEYRLSEVSLPKKRKLQLALPISFGRGMDRDQLLRQIFDLFMPAGFTRMRFFQRIGVPGSDGVLVLKKWYPVDSIHQAIGVPGGQWQHPLGGIMLEKLKRFEYAEGPSKLEYDIAPHADETAEKAASDEGLRFWNRITRAGEISQWLRLAILCKYEDAGPAKFQARGLLIIDKFGSADTRIEPDEVDKQSPSLISACRELSRILQVEYDREQRKSIEGVPGFEGVLDFYRNTVSQISVQDRPVDFQRQFVTYACQCSKADEGKLYLTRNLDAPPASVAVYPLNRDFAANEVVNSERNPAAYDAWRNRAETFFPRFQEKQEAKEQSRVAFPLQVGDRIFGILTLRHSRSFHFDDHRVNALRRLIDLFVFPLWLAWERWDRRLWEISLAHSFKETNALLRQEHASLDAIPGVRESRAYQTVEAASLRLRDISTAFIDFSMKDDDNHPRESERDIPADKVLLEAIHFAELMKDDGRHRIQKDLHEGSISVDGNKTRLEFVLRTLLHNALYHGLTGVINVRSFIDGNHWTVEITNPTEISDEAFNSMFVAFARQTQDGREGSHVGLAAALHWTENYGGSLRRERLPNGISFSLKWPLAKV